MFHISTFYDCCERDYSFLKQSLSKKADELSIVGTIILTPEGINSTIACANLEILYSFETYIAKYFPSIDIESKVLMNSIEEISEAQAKSYASFISFVRKLNLNKIPSLIESVEWVKYNFLNKNKSTIDNLGVLLKDKSDQEKYKEQIENANELIQE